MVTLLERIFTTKGTGHRNISNLLASWNLDIVYLEGHRRHLENIPTKYLKCVPQMEVLCKARTGTIECFS